MAIVYDTFVWCPSTQSSADGTFSTLTAQFGDGYAQEAGNGLHTESQNWNLMFVGKSPTIAPILNFIKIHQGYRAFLWTPPLSDEPRYYKVKTYSLNPSGADVFSLSLTFTEAFKP